MACKKIMDEVLNVCWPTTARCAVLPGVRGCRRPHEPNVVQRHGRMQCSSVDEALFPRPLEDGGDVRRELMDLRTMIDSQSCGHCSYRFGRKKIMMLAHHHDVLVAELHLGHGDALALSTGHCYESGPQLD
ncbi:hypothetical protein PHYPSEUDO_010100 [Phytophthora pseudosyringae]|uniref:Uncharacterized protein n=1 Tax=Phytophthora pseudosyringae TaxID=221518 RepID=A0A8T1VDV5_9STRA|nr:hypothetical protein PHYPSEUDO_010100 [Phytophthora pseudosyringae]